MVSPSRGELKLIFGTTEWCHRVSPHGGGLKQNSALPLVAQANVSPHGGGLKRRYCRKVYDRR